MMAGLTLFTAITMTTKIRPNQLISRHKEAMSYCIEGKIQLVQRLIGRS